MIEIDKRIPDRMLLKDRYIFIPGDIQFEELTFTETFYDPREHAWLEKFHGAQLCGVDRSA
ncbi:hypothetical protein [Ruegeria sp. Ofav3-42]|uniref:hypothetical protein n=1 Tax=Ruegeria sp. Ofav3-42 TaxID=2917759 RepID=UPI001EF4D478|nr:hypothetical protein [Ruegeria sp. Ofav3-42]MCG7521771.1 hypothetical protein [Ruegeria sp. Ofav3-42]